MQGRKLKTKTFRTESRGGLQHSSSETSTKTKRDKSRPSMNVWLSNRSWPSCTPQPVLFRTRQEPGQQDQLIPVRAISQQTPEQERRPPEYRPISRDVALGLRWTFRSCETVRQDLSRENQRRCHPTIRFWAYRCHASQSRYSAILRPGIRCTLQPSMRTNSKLCGIPYQRLSH
jgi:hypothetical protein